MVFQLFSAVFLCSFRVFTGVERGQKSLVFWVFFLGFYLKTKEWKIRGGRPDLFRFPRFLPNSECQTALTLRQPLPFFGAKKVRNTRKKKKKKLGFSYLPNPYNPWKREQAHKKTRTLTLQSLFFSFSDFPCFFFAFFLPFPRILGVPRREKTLLFWGKNPCFFFPKKQGLECQGKSQNKKQGKQKKHGLEAHWGVNCVSCFRDCDKSEHIRGTPPCQPPFANPRLNQDISKCRVAPEPNWNRKPEPSEPFFPKPKAEPEPPELFSRNRNRNRNRSFLSNCTETPKNPLPQKNRRNRKPEPLEPFHPQTATEPNRGLPENGIFSTRCRLNGGFPCLRNPIFRLSPLKCRPLLN